MPISKSRRKGKTKSKAKRGQFLRTKINALKSEQARLEAAIKEEEKSLSYADKTSDKPFDPKG